MARSRGGRNERAPGAALHGAGEAGDGAGPAVGAGSAVGGVGAGSAVGAGGRSEPAGAAADGAARSIQAALLDPSLVHLHRRLGVIECRIGLAVARRRLRGATPDDPWLGLVITDEQVDRILAGGALVPRLDPDGPLVLPDPAAPVLAEVEAAADVAAAEGRELRLRTLQQRFGLDQRELELLLVVLAPDLDVRFERLYGYLNDDVTRRRATVALALELTGVATVSTTARRTLGPSSRLVGRALVVVEEPERPWLTRALRVPDRVAAWCLGDDTVDETVAGAVTLMAAGASPAAAGPSPAPSGAVGTASSPHRSPAATSSAGGRVEPPSEAAAVGRMLHRGALVYLRERAGASGRALGQAAWQAAGRPALVCDLDRLRADETASDVMGVLVREAALRGAGLVVGPVDALAEQAERGDATLTQLVDGVDGGLVLHGRRAWDGRLSRRVPVLASAGPAAPAALDAAWRQGLHGAPVAAGLDPVAATAQFRLTPEEVGFAATVARQQAELGEAQVDAGYLQLGARSHNSPALERLARRIEPAVGWDDLVLPPAAAAHLRELAARARQRDTVLGAWGMRPGGGRGRGVVALFAGVSGTGKTMSAEVLAADLSMDLYTVNLATVVDKYVGETEKNLERIFAAADGVDAVLLFDEADALFGRRSEVQDANDRYANIEVAYLLQQMERFDGLAVLSTNLRSNIDDAFVRRLDAIVEFPSPDGAARRALWDRCLTPSVPRADDLDLDFCAAAFDLTGGSIAAIALSAAYLAAESGRAVTMADLVRATQREYHKLGRLCTEADFGRYWALVER